MSALSLLIVLNIFAGEVSGGENNSNLFPTPTATYLPTPTFAATY